MKTPQQIRNEVLKEVLKRYNPSESFIVYNKGLKKELTFSIKQAIDLTLTEYDKSIKEMIEGLEVRKQRFGIGVKESTKYYVLWKDIQELLSKIGDNSEVKE